MLSVTRTTMIVTSLSYKSQLRFKQDLNGGNVQLNRSVFPPNPQFVFLPSGEGTSFKHAIICQPFLVPLTVAWYLLALYVSYYSLWTRFFQLHTRLLQLLTRLVPLLTRLLRLLRNCYNYSRDCYNFTRDCYNCSRDCYSYS